MRTVVAVSVVVLGFLVPAGAQAPVPPLPDPPAQAPGVFRSSANLVALNVTVTKGDKLVTGLGAADFAVFEDGVRQEVRFFEASAVPMDVILLIDCSSSMRSRMPLVHEAARGFMRVLRPGDRGAVVGFAAAVRVLQDLTSDRAAIEAAIGSTEAKGSTAFRTAVYVALKQFGRPARGHGEVRRQALAVLSDGHDTASLLSLDDVLTLARKVGVNIYTISLQSAENLDELRSTFSESDYAMKTLAQETGAQAFFPVGIHELKDVYGTIARELEAQYSIAYAPTNSRADGRFRRVSVRVTSNPAYKPRARVGYTADAAPSSAGLRKPDLR